MPDGGIKTFDAALALYEQAMAEARQWRAGAEVRVAKLRTVLALERAGRPVEAADLLAEVKAEQEAAHAEPE